jgi:hypothetical protein
MRAARPKGNDAKAVGNARAAPAIELLIVVSFDHAAATSDWRGSVTHVRAKGCGPLHSEEI